MSDVRAQRTPSARAPGRILIALALVALGSVTALERASANPPAYTTEPDVRLSPAMRDALDDVGRRFHERTGQRIHVTSGTRTALEQAGAMYDKLVHGQSLTRLYRDFEAASAIQDTYRGCRRQGRARCVNAMSEVIQRQIHSGCYISRHLVATAADVRSRTMSRRQRVVFTRIVEDSGRMSLLEEGTPPHFHLQLE
ncbi:MAG: hypothetical protein AB7S26_38650 [Sandaracinaceae bacterium]